MPTRILALLLAALSLYAAEDPAAIMAQVAANVENGAAARRQYVYQQRVKATLTQSNGKLNRREDRLYAVIPHETTTEKKLERFTGEYRNGNKMVPYTEPHKHRNNKDDASDGIDAGLINSIVEDLVDDKKSPDGIPRDLFPLRTGDLASYKFSSLGEREWEGRRVLRIGFEPNDPKGLCVHVGSETPEGDCKPWSGEAWIDAEERFPVRIDTKLARGIPWAVRAFLGTNVQQLGFTVNYHRAGPGAWFPSTYGTEFKLNVLFFYKRTIALSLESSDFRKTDSSSTIQFEQ
jgi:hypothetical protein